MASREAGAALRGVGAAEVGEELKKHREASGLRDRSGVERGQKQDKLGRVR